MSIPIVGTPAQLIAEVTSLTALLTPLAATNPLAAILLTLVISLTPTLTTVLGTVLTIVLSLVSLLGNIAAPGGSSLLSASQLTAIINSILPQITGLLTGGGLLSIVGGLLGVGQNATGGTGTSGNSTSPLGGLGGILGGLGL